jgi:hypothetical protein
VPARLRHRRGHQVRAPDLVAGGRQVRPHDHRYSSSYRFPFPSEFSVCNVIILILYRRACVRAPVQRTCTTTRRT